MRNRINLAPLAVMIYAYNCVINELAEKAGLSEEEVKKIMHKYVEEGYALFLKRTENGGEEGG